MAGRKISELPQRTFESDIIDNCFFVDKINTPHMASVALKSVFDEIIKRAKNEGLTVELKSDKIVFISNQTQPK